MPRLDHALDDGLRLSAPIAFINPTGMVDLAGIDPDTIHASTGNIVEFERLRQRGIPVTPTQEAESASSVVFCHRSKQATFHLIARAFQQTAPGGTVAIDGAKTDGIESINKALKERFGGVETISKAHGKLIWTQRPDTLPQLDHWISEPRQVDGFWTSAGVFSADGIDAGSALLIKHLPKLKGRGVDLGAGWGFLAHHVLTSADVVALDLIEADHAALEMARRNIDDPRATFHWADVMTHQGQYDFVVSNPPFHTSRKAEPAIGQGFISKAAHLLAPKGSFWMVANKNLPYEAVLGDHFAQIDVVAQTGGFKVISASRAIRSKAAQKPHRLRSSMQRG